MSELVMEKGAELQICGVTKLYGQSAAVKDLDLHVKSGRFVTLLGASGSGKTTTLMMLAGFTFPTSGHIRIGGKDVTSLPPGKRDLGVVFQNYSLFPHMTVAQNLAFPLEMRGRSKAEIERLVRETLDVVHLGKMADRYPRQLSGGQQQRVALARAIIFEPQALLMDEPLGALDKNLREHMQIEIKRLHASLGATIVFVTHDQEEALTMSDEIAVMQDGRIAQIADPKTIYERPDSRFVASFIGQSNFLKGKVEGNDGNTVTLRLADGSAIRCQGRPDLKIGEEASAVLRPERVSFGELATVAQGATLKGRVSDVLYLGHTIKLSVTLPDGSEIMTQSGAGTLGGSAPETGSEVTIGWGSEPLWCVAGGEAA
ncbi:ABC transporter ATP-binding protein [Agrobacterium vitis]|uniref:ABC transporter ATP-binding protein n=1 Tax=Agrobacterium vitis TaxID=373 RepID=UPI0012E76BD3|nr:ABC transporter ATP-binding protein [Agrobacterium vitis]MVA23865.1 polyamine ABC transporter ATP-binding protein [Agrobacterium vitis]